LDPGFKTLDELLEEESKLNLTINEKMYSLLRIDEETAYNIYEI
jgi:hypothetical protein